MSLYLVTVLTNICLFSFIALSAYLILIVGEVSFGQQAFFGIGAYSLAIFYVYFDLSIIYSIFFGMVICFCLGLLLSLLTIKLALATCDPKDGWLFLIMYVPNILPSSSQTKQ